MNSILLGGISETRIGASLVRKRLLSAVGDPVAEFGRLL